MFEYAVTNGFWQTFGYLNSNLYGIAVIFATYIALKLCKKHFVTDKYLPPGPWGLPFVGYLPFIDSLPEVTFNKLALKYGPVFGLQIGSRYCVVLNDYDIVKEAYQKDVFSGRPPGTFRLAVESSRHFSEVNGEEWKEERKLFAHFFRQITKSGNSKPSMLELTITSEIEKFMPKIDQAGGAPFNLDSVGEFTYNVVYRYIFGQDMSNVDSETLQAIDQLHLSMLYTGYAKALCQSFPRFRFITRWFEPLLRNFERNNAIADKLVWKEIENHKLELDKDNPKDYIDYYLLWHEQYNGRLTSENTLGGNLIMLLTAGNNTVKITIQWLLLLLAHHQEIQEKAYIEIISHFAKEHPTWDDRERLPYIYASILESMRLFTQAPINSPRCAMEDTIVKGFKVPKGTVVYSNNWLMNHDDSYWKKPSEFQPERYLEESQPDKVKSSERMLSLSYGRRECPGKLQTMMQTFLLLTRILRRFVVLPVDGKSHLDSALKGMVSVPDKPYVKFQSRQI